MGEASGGFATALDIDVRTRKFALPPPDITVAEHAETYRKLSPETSELHGNYSLDVTPFWREPLEWYTRDDCEFIKVIKGTQIGWSTLMECVIAYHVHLDPCGIIALFPTQDNARDWSVEKWTPMVRDMPVLHDLVYGRRSKAGQNSTNLAIRFKGGVLNLVWSNSAAQLSQKSRRFIIVEEPDRCSGDAKNEGHSIDLVINRGDAFSNRKVIMGGTPTVKNASAIITEMGTTDWRLYYVPCARCDSDIHLIWDMVGWDREGGGDVKAYEHPIYGLNRPDTAYLECPVCRGRITNDEKNSALIEGKWVPTRPYDGQAGFALNSLYSPFEKSSLAHGVRKYLAAQKRADIGDFSKMTTFVNTFAGDPYEEPSVEDYKAENITHLREPMGNKIAAGIHYITAFVDPGQDHMAITFMGHGDEEETWGLLYHELPIGMKEEKKDVTLLFDELDHWLFDTEFQHPSGRVLKVAAAGVDTGNWTKELYEYVKNRRYKADGRLYACKGEDGWEKRAGWYKSSYIKDSNIILRLMYVDQVKYVVMQRTMMTEPGPGYMHVNSNFPAKWEEQMTSNRLKAKWRNGQRIQYWEKDSWKRDEALDTWVGNIVVREIAKRYLEGLERPDERTVNPFKPENVAPDPVLSPREAPFVDTGRRRGGWMNR